MKNLCLLLVVACFNGCVAWSTGGPPSICLAHHAHHSTNKFQMVECPYKLSYDIYTYTPSQDIVVTIEAPGNPEFKGFLVYAHRKVGDIERPVGDYVNFDENKAGFIDCVNQTNAGLTSITNATVTKFVFTFKAPDTNVGPIFFKYMIVKEFSTFWIEQKAPVIQPAETYVPAVDYPMVGDTLDDIDWAECGVSKGCFLYPSNCTGNADCTAAATFKKVNGSYEIEAFVSGHEFIRLVFSNDPVEPMDHVHACVAGYNMTSIQHGYNYRHYMRTFTDGQLTNMAVKLVDGKITCKFTRPAEMLVWTRNYGDELWNLDDDLYMFMNWGPVDYESVRLYRPVMPNVRSDGRVDFSGNDMVQMNMTAPATSAPAVTPAPTTPRIELTTRDAGTRQQGYTVIVSMAAVLALALSK